jgi:hypothetical protein
VRCLKKEGRPQTTVNIVDSFVYIGKFNPELIFFPPSGAPVGK